jgi:hypothetical protein
MEDNPVSIDWVRYETLDWERPYTIGYFVADSMQKGKDVQNCSRKICGKETLG